MNITIKLARSTLTIFCALIFLQTTGPGDEGSCSSAATRRGSVLPTAGADDRRRESEESHDQQGRRKTCRSEKQVRKKKNKWFDTSTCLEMLIPFIECIDLIRVNLIKKESKTFCTEIIQIVLHNSVPLF